MEQREMYVFCLELGMQYLIVQLNRKKTETFNYILKMVALDNQNHWWLYYRG